MASIEHTEAEGTLLVGTSKGDGTAEVVKALGWRWGRSIGMWFVPRSRDHLPRRDLIERTAKALREAGHEVEVEIDATPRDRAEREERLQQRSSERARRLSERAEREEGKSEDRRATVEQISSGIPFGQPILLGHHSQRCAERDAQRIHRNMAAAIEHEDRARHARHQAQEAQAATGARHSQVTVGNRIEHLAAEVRRAERAIEVHPLAEGEQPTPWHTSTLERLAADRADLAYWTQLQQEKTEAGEFTSYGPGTVAVGDAVRVAGSWRRVARVNAKSVAVETGYSWTNRVPWHKVTDHRPAGQRQEEQ